MTKLNSNNAAIPRSYLSFFSAAPLAACHASSIELRQYKLMTRPNGKEKCLHSIPNRQLQVFGNNVPKFGQTYSQY